MPRIVAETTPWQAAPRALPPGRAVFAIGDVHAHADHLWSLQERISGIIALELGEEAVSVVWLGDYVDRGWQPLETLDLVAAGLGQPGVEEIRLVGNHEIFLIEAASGEDVSLPRLLNWWRFGGAETLKTLAPEARIEEPGELVAALSESLGPGRLDFLRGLALQHRIGDYVFVHAGLNPERPLEAQEEQDLLWIREPFLSGRDWPHPVTVVHGHTPEGPTALDHRIGVDSGVFSSGRLSAVELRGDRLRFISTREEN
ncbi:metallophosphoesterase [Pelagibius marinus]|uniref:metallophosphoesterase n=1 Tax=Pelagibius marinus TaxID=2762760 RepID=UPI0018723FD3|nr:metallophosphoesterase [Pelagibius marinus]